MSSRPPWAPPESDPPALRMAVISDIHHGTPSQYRGQWRKLSQYALELTERFVERVNAEVRPDLVAHLGDAIQDAGPQEDERLYAEVMEVLAGLRCPILHVTGNHDEAFLPAERLRALRPPGALVPPVEWGGQRLCVLPSHNTLERCWTDEDAVQALEADLAGHDGPALLLVHHTLADTDLTGNPWFEDAPQQCLIEGREAIRRRLARSGRLRAVINGHLHWNRLAVHGDLPCFTLHSLVENIAPADAEPLPAAAWSLVEVWESRLHVRVFGNAPADWGWEG
jgi:calcineurin-like phosphoesterase family protein